jgi:hypothetical protein
MNYEGSAPRPSFTIRKGWSRFVLKPERGKPGRKRGKKNANTTKILGPAKSYYESGHRPPWIARQIKRVYGITRSPKGIEMMLRRYHPELFRKNP